MWTPELVVSIAGFVITFSTMLYKFGRLEGTFSTEIRELRRRVTRIETPFSVPHDRV